MRRFAASICLFSALVFAGCASYEPKVAPFKLPEAYQNVQRVDDAYVAARAWNNEEEARQAFGFNIVKAGTVAGAGELRQPRLTRPWPSSRRQTFLINQQQELFPVLADQEAYERVNRGTKVQETVKGAAKGGLLGGATGALIGTAIGVVAGHSAGDLCLAGPGHGRGHRGRLRRGRRRGQYLGAPHHHRGSDAGMS